MNYQELTQLIAANPADSAIEELKSGKRNTGKIDPEKKTYKTFYSQLEPELHDVSNPLIRKDKVIKTDSGTETESVARIALALQKLIVKRAVAFLFGNAPSLSADMENSVLDAVKAVFRDTHINTINRRIAKTMMSNREVAEYWYIEPSNEENLRYGFKSTDRLRCAIFAPEKGDTLYPYFDDNENLLAFSREYTKTRGKQTETYFETYTKDEIFKWRVSGKDTTLLDGYPRQHILGKIPIVYGEQEKVEWADVQSLIDRLEKLLSNFADTNDYHASPKIVVNGQILSWAKKGESGAVIEMAEGGTAQYLSWAQAPQAVELEINTLLRMIHAITQTPDISFENVKSLGGVSGVALKLLFMDSHLKAQEKREIFDEYMQRRISIIKAYLALMNPEQKFKTDCRDTIITAEIKPYTIDDIASELNIIQSANGNQAVISHETSVELGLRAIGLGKDPADELSQIRNEQTEAIATASAFGTI